MNPLSDTHVLIEAKKPSNHDLAPMYFYVSLLSLFGIPLLFIALPIGLLLLFVALIIFLYFYTRMSAVYEAFKLDGEYLHVIKGNRVVWNGPIKDIKSVDIDTFSEFQAQRGFNMVVFYFADETSWSFNYTNYQYEQLQKLKSLLS